MNERGELLVSAKDVWKSYDSGRITVLQGASLEVRAGELVSLWGSSGSGKSTLLHLIGGLDIPEKGALTVCSLDPAKERDRLVLRRRHLGFVFQLHNLIPDLTVVENLRVPAIAALGPDPLHEGIDVGRLTARLALRRKLSVKVAIMDQALIPGVGNIQASEGLFRAAIHPRRPASSLTPPEVRRLASSLLASFRYTIRAFGADKADGGNKDITYVGETGTRNPFKVYDRAGVPCPRCGKGTITRVVQAGRSTYFCPACQH